MIQLLKDNKMNTRKFFFVSIILVILLVIVSLSLVSKSITYNRYKKEYERNINQIKQQKELEIKKANNKIIDLLKKNVILSIEISEANHKIDSLEKVKNKVVIKYQIKYKQIDKYNAEQILKYWKNELK